MTCQTCLSLYKGLSIGMPIIKQKILDQNLRDISVMKGIYHGKRNIFARDGHNCSDKAKESSVTIHCISKG